MQDAGTDLVTVGSPWAGWTMTPWLIRLGSAAVAVRDCMNELLWARANVCGDTDESPAQQEPVPMAPEGVIFLLGGATEVCRHLPRAWLVVSRAKA